MQETVLITGGAGFIGSHLADRLLGAGYRVRVLDSLVSQVHGPEAARPAYLDERVELLVGDVRDAAAMEAALRGADAVVHLASAVGVGQSMYSICEYTSVNNVGTAVLLEAALQRRPRRLVVASSMSVYGEGRYASPEGQPMDDVERSREQLLRGVWDPEIPGLEPIATPEEKSPRLSSVYALSKLDQERLCLMIGQAYDLPTVALRFFNVYGPRQSLSNPYTGVLSIFASRLLNERPPLIFEDGEQMRDFVSVHDVTQACQLALEKEGAAGGVFNVGSGRPVTVKGAAAALARSLDRPVEAEITGRFRVGDVRHCFADIGRARGVLGYEPRVDFESGLDELTRWLRGRKPIDRAEEARRELQVRGLTA